MALECLDGDRAVLRRVGEGETWPGCVVAGFDGGEPGGFDWEAGGGMEVPDKCSYAW